MRATSLAVRPTSPASLACAFAGVRLIRWMVGTVLATGGLTVAILRFLG